MPKKSHALAGVASFIAFIVTWVLFGAAVWISGHPQIENLVYSRLGLDGVFIPMLALSAIGLGHNEKHGRRDPAHRPISASRCPQISGAHQRAHATLPLVTARHAARRD